MSAANQFKFDPGLFGDKSAREATGPTPAHTVVRLRRWPIVALFVGVTIVGAALVRGNILEGSGRYDSAEMPTLGFPGEPVIAKIASTSHNVPVPITPQSSGWCDDGDALCTKLTTSRPGEALRKIIATIPQGTAKQYRIQVSITPIEEAPTE